MRRALGVAVVIAVLAATPGALGKPIQGLTGNTARFTGQTAQATNVRQAFLGWGHGQSYGAPFTVLFKTLGPIPMIHLGTLAQGSKTKQAITTAGIAAGQGDGYLAALNAAVSAWGNAIYIRPMAEMNNAGNPWSHDAAAYKTAFQRIYRIVHGNVAGLQPAYRGPVLASNPFPRVRVLWSPLAGGSDFKQYWPGAAYVDVGGGDIYKERSGEPPWQKLEDIYRFVKAQGKPWSVPEWGMFGVDAPEFVQKMCDHFKTHPTETQEFYESKPGSIFDLGDKPASRAVYRRCITPYAGALPSWAKGGPGTAKQIVLSLTPDVATGDAPLDVSFAIEAKLSVPIVQWQVVFGDGQSVKGAGEPPDAVDHTYQDDGAYQAVLIVYQGPPFTGTAIRFLTTAKVTVGSGNAPVTFTPVPGSGKAPLKVSFTIRTKLPSAGRSWQIVFGDGLTNQGTGLPPRFAGHTYEKPGTYRVLLIVDAAPYQGTLVRLIIPATVRVT